MWNQNPAGSGEPGSERSSLPDHEEALVQRNGREEENGGEDGLRRKQEAGSEGGSGRGSGSGRVGQLLLDLHGGDDHPSVHDELSQRGRALVAVPAVNHEQAADVSELSDGEIGRQRRLLPFLQTNQTSA